MTGQNCQPEGCQGSGYITDYRESFRVIAAQDAATAPGSRWHYLQSGAQHRDGALRVRMVSGAGLAGEQDAPDEGHEVGGGEVIADGAAARSAGQSPARTSEATPRAGWPGDAATRHGPAGSTSGTGSALNSLPWCQQAPKNGAMSSNFQNFADVPGGYLYYQASGQGQDVVLFNGGTADLRMWDTTAAWLTQIARVTAFDYRDTGLSSAGTAPYSEIDDITAVLDDAGIESAVLVGCSEGGRRALAFAHQHPERASRVVVVDGSFGDFPGPSLEETAAWQEMLTKFTEIDRVLADEGVRAAAEVDLDAWGPALGSHDRRLLIGLQVANTHRIMLQDFLGGEYLGRELDPPVKTRFAEITTPISVLLGGRDFTGTALWARRLVNQAPSATLTVIPEADHFPMLSAPQEFERILRELLQLAPAATSRPERSTT
jgi:3-oxoadipate enol-lactonase